MYWLIYYHTGKLEGFQAKNFDEFQEIEMWIKEMEEKITVVDVVKSLNKD